MFKFSFWGTASAIVLLLSLVIGISLQMEKQPIESHFKSVEYPSVNTPGFLMAIFSNLMEEGKCSEERFRVYIGETNGIASEPFRCQVISDYSLSGFAFVKREPQCEAPYNIPYYQPVHIDCSKVYPVLYLPKMVDYKLIYVFRMTASKDQLFPENPAQAIRLKEK